MEIVKLNDGSVEIIGSHRDLVDIVRDKCGDDIAKMIDVLDPAAFEDVYDAYENIMGASDLLDKDEYEENDIECAKILLNKAISLLSSVL